MSLAKTDSYHQRARRPFADTESPQAGRPNTRSEERTLAEGWRGRPPWPFYVLPATLVSTLSLLIL